MEKNIKSNEYISKQATIDNINSIIRRGGDISEVLQIIYQLPSYIINFIDEVE